MLEKQICDPFPRPRTHEASAPSSATCQQSGHQNIAPQVTLWVGLQTGTNALIKTINGRDFSRRPIERHPDYRFGGGPCKSGIGRGKSCHIAATPELDDKGGWNLQRLGALDGKRPTHGGILSLQRYQ
jgi:hypothetical protein